MFGSASRISMNFRLLKFKWKTVFQLEKKSWNTSLSRLTDFYQAEVGGKWGCWVWEGRGSASRWVLFSGPRHPTDERLICRAIYTNSALTSSNCLSAYAAPCLLINVSTGHQHRVTLGVFLIQSKEIKLISMQTLCSRGLELAALWMPHPCQNHEENELIFFLSSNFSLSYVYVS